MIKAIIFDFDGVIIESANIKTEAFAEIFSDFPQKLKEIIDYHLVNAGISRYAKFRYIYEHILGQSLSKEKELELGRRFSQIVLQKVLSAPFVSGAKEFLDMNKHRFQFFIASGTPEEELMDIIYARRLQEHFREIHGSPKQKSDIINEIINHYHFTREEVVYVGDAESDRIAAEQAKIFFIERIDNSQPSLDSYPWRVRDLFDLNEVLKKISD